MKRLAFLFRPGWIALALVVVAFAYLCFTVLAPWQLGKNTKTSRENAQIAASLKADPVAVTTVLPHQDSAASRRWPAERRSFHRLRRCRPRPSGLLWQNFQFQASRFRLPRRFPLQCCYPAVIGYLASKYPSPKCCRPPAPGSARQFSPPPRTPHVAPSAPAPTASL